MTSTGARLRRGALVLLAAGSATGLGSAPMTASAAAAPLAAAPLAVAVTPSATPPATPPGAVTSPRNAPARVDCTVTDERLEQLSGLSARRGTLYAVSDQSATVFELDDQCEITRENDLKQPVTDLEDLGQSVDGLLWLADTGGNREPRSSVAVLRFNPESGRVERYVLDYPDGPHDAEALLVTPNAQVYVVTKDEAGTSGVYTAPSPLDPVAGNGLQRVAQLDVRSIEARSRGNGSTLVTGGAMSYDGTRFVLRTYLDAFEWQAPDGDVAAAIATGTPRVLPLPVSQQGEAVTYDEGGQRLLLSGEQLPSPLHSVPLGRTEAAVTATPATGTSPAGRTGLLVGGGVALLLALGALGAAVLRRSRPAPDDRALPGT